MTDTITDTMHKCSRDIVLAAITHQTPDRVPMDFGGTAMSTCTGDFLRRLREVLGYDLADDRDADGDIVDEAIQQYLGVDLRWVSDTPPLVVLRDIDPIGYQQRLIKRNSTVVDTSIKTPGISHLFPLADISYDNVKTLKPAPVSSPCYLEWIIAQAKAYRKAGYATSYWVSSGFFETGCWMRGYEQFAIDLLTDPDLVRALFDIWLHEHLERVEQVVKPLAPWIDIFCFGDDLGLQTGPFMSQAIFRALIKPYMIAYYTQVHAAAPNSFIFHHSCGSVAALLADFIEIGIDILNPIQPNAAGMNPEYLKSIGGGRLCYHGGIDLQQLLPFGTPDEVAKEVVLRKDILGEGGGYICAPAHSLPEDVPVENILSLFSR